MTLDKAKEDNFILISSANLEGYPEGKEHLKGTVLHHPFCPPKITRAGDTITVTFQIKDIER